MAEQHVPTLKGRLVATQALEVMQCHIVVAIDVLDRQSGGEGPFYTDQQKIAAARTVLDGIQLALGKLLRGKV